MKTSSNKTKSPKIDYFDRKRKIVEQKIKVLVNRPIFQKQIKELRVKWKVPMDGIKSEDERMEWYWGLDKDTKAHHLEIWPKYRSKIKELREAGEFAEAEKIKDEYNADVPLNAYRNDIWRIVRSFRLSPRWHNSIERYLLFNDPENMGPPIGVTIQKKWENGLELLSIHVDGDTTLADVKKVWPTVKMHQRNLNYRQEEKFQPIPNLDRDKRAYELQQEGKSWEDIADIIEDEFEDSLDYNEIKIAIKRYKKRLNIN